MIPTTQPNAAERAWREAVREAGCILNMPGPVEVHHVVGRAARHLRIPIGHWWLIPVSNEAHRIVERMPKEDQKELFRQVCEEHIRCTGSLPVPGAVMAAIWSWHR